MTLGFDTTTDEVIAGLDRSHTVAVITGASTGIGLETARALASVGATVVLAGRNAEKHRAAIQAIRERHPRAEVSHVELDLTSLTGAREAAAAVRDAHTTVHLLINNAGVMYTPFERTADGFELQFGTNHLGHFVFTNHLLPAVLNGAPARIVNLSSGGHGSSDIIWDDPNYRSRPYDKFEAYGQAKTANILFTVELERRLHARGVQAYAVHPGMIVTELGRYMTRDDMKLLRSRIAASATSSGAPATYKSIEQGAATTVWAATAPELDGHGGTYLADCAICTTHAPYARDVENAKRLWSMSEELVGESFPEGVEADAMTARSLYLYEVVDVVGQGQYDYMEHLWKDPVLRMPEMFGLQGSFYVCAAGGGRWPQVINIWDIGSRGWKGWASNVDRMNLKRRKAFYGDWWDEAAKWRSGGFDRLCGGVPGSPTTEEIPAAGIRGTLFVNEILTVRPGSALEFLAAVNEQRVPFMRDHGHRATGLYEVMSNQHEVIMVWATSIADQVRLRQNRDTTRGLCDEGEVDDRIVAWEQLSADYVVGGDTHVMTPLPRTVYGPDDWEDASLAEWLAD